MSSYVAAYDISEPRVRNAVIKVLERYGQRVQESVFELRVAPEELAELRLEVGMHLRRTDSFDFYPVDETGTRRHLRWQRPIERHRGVLLL